MASGMEKFSNWLQSRRGNKSALAVHLGLTPGAVGHWGIVPAERLRAIEAFTGIPRHDLRPDIFEGYVSHETLESSNA